jgi:hypothetical protein
MGERTVRQEALSYEFSELMISMLIIIYCFDLAPENIRANAVFSFRDLFGVARRNRL